MHATSGQGQPTLHWTSSQRALTVLLGCQPCVLGHAAHTHVQAAMMRCNTGRHWHWHWWRRQWRCLRTCVLLATSSLAAARYARCVVEHQHCTALWVTSGPLRAVTTASPANDQRAPQPPPATRAAARPAHSHTPPPGPSSHCRTRSAAQMARPPSHVARITTARAPARRRPRRPIWSGPSCRSPLERSAAAAAAPAGRRHGSAPQSPCPSLSRSRLPLRCALVPPRRCCLAPPGCLCCSEMRTCVCSGRG